MKLSHCVPEHTACTLHISHGCFRRPFDAESPTGDCSITISIPLLRVIRRATASLRATMAGSWSDLNIMRVQPVAFSLSPNDTTFHSMVGPFTRLQVRASPSMFTIAQDKHCAEASLLISSNGRRAAGAGGVGLMLAKVGVVYCYSRDCILRCVHGGVRRRAAAAGHAMATPSSIRDVGIRLMVFPLFGRRLKRRAQCACDRCLTVPFQFCWWLELPRFHRRSVFARLSTGSAGGITHLCVRTRAYGPDGLPCRWFG